MEHYISLKVMYLVLPHIKKKPIPKKGFRTLVPVQPSKIICVGLNYADHAAESGLEVPKTPLFGEIT